jgi:hypothetical protein
MKPPTAILKHWSISEPVFPATDSGLINDTFVVGREPSGILQCVNPIFGPEIHQDIEAITNKLAAAGMLTPVLVHTDTGELCVPTADGAWRLLSFIPGTTIHRISCVEQAASAAALVGRFHRVTASMDHQFHFIRPGAHDTTAHMATLKTALNESDGHPLAARIQTLGTAILESWERWEGDLDLPARICHGDLKISNIRFDSTQQTALCLLDFDTFSHQTISVEMGDAWRSWCNPAGEDNVDATRFDLEIFRASALAWLSNGPELSQKEERNLVPGIERICLELAARFCTDAVRQSYFKEDCVRFPIPGAHNLHRAEGQFKLGRSANDHRNQAERILKSR